jgi:epoxide hydrolase-like predicted phosphatase
MPIRAVIFDIGGVLLRTQDRSYHRKWETTLGLVEGGLAKEIYVSAVSAQATLGQASVEEVWQYATLTFHLNAEQIEELKRDFSATEAIDEELLTFLRSLHPRYRTALLSNAWPGAREHYNQRYRLSDAVDEMIFSAEEGLAKPDPAIFTLAAQRLGAQLNEMIFVDDWPPHVEAARTLGMRGIVFENTDQVIAEMRSYLEMV